MEGLRNVGEGSLSHKLGRPCETCVTTDVVCLDTDDMHLEKVNFVIWKSHTTTHDRTDLLFAHMKKRAEPTWRFGVLLTFV